MNNNSYDKIKEDIRKLLCENVIDTCISSELFNLEYKMQMREIDSLEEKIYGLVNEFGSNMENEFKRQIYKIEREKNNIKEIIELRKEFLMIKNKINKK
ncbi:hypothetical protein SLOPH_668 [Spraguea lophii 42_110]|uniref:Uncharacterized protein n=1 Tax=Spraguea lophii (strain 42_110) TaxID=1358809 RepID=S7XPE6_SPRLO|nr:hypothetical protein SLOPH_668 [Spraguea lophii 42_110]